MPADSKVLHVDGLSKKPAKSTSQDHQVDIFRDTPIRYLGYANEIGEAFRSQVHVNWVRLSYAVATSYVVADSHSKGQKAAETFQSRPDVRLKIVHAVGDTLIWQGLASVAIPGFTINRLCKLSNFVLRKTTALPPNILKWTVTGIGLAAIPFIIKPIDRSVDFLMESTIRKWYHIEDVEEQVVHHKRDD